jgi:hypothetical protein
MSQYESSSVWTDLEALDDQQLQQLTAAAVHVLQTGGDHDTAHAAEMPSRVLIRELQAALNEEDVPTATEDAGRLVTDQVASRPVAIALLRELAKNPELAAEIERAYEARRDMMVIDAGLLLGGALLLLVLKLKRIRVGDKEVEFYEAKAGALAQVRTFLGA